LIFFIIKKEVVIGDYADIQIIWQNFLHFFVGHYLGMIY